MLTQNELIQTPPLDLSTIPTPNQNNTVDSIFIIRSLLAAIIKDCISNSTEIAISKLTQEITSLQKEERISDSYFSHIDSQFYLVLSNAKGYKRLANLIVSEKRHIDAAIGSAMKSQESYRKIIRAYGNILEGIQSTNYNAALSALSELSSTLRALTLKV